ncbi:MAG: translation initiation factor [Opitutaceae bacterium]|nr:translation initiation factor [Opitutaceae bacterium]
MSAGNKIPTDGGTPLGQNPFAGLKAGETGDRRPVTGGEKTEAGSPLAAPKSLGDVQKAKGGDQGAGQGALKPERGAPESIRALRPPASNLPPPPRNRGRVDITRQTAGRGGRTVTVVSGFLGISQAEKEQLAKKMQKTCGTGGTVKDGCIEIQGDKREQVAKILTEAGFRPVFAGG